MEQIKLPADTLQSLFRITEKYKKADVLSAKVGLVLVPLFFIGFSYLSFYFLPEALSLWVAGLCLAAGLILEWFILRYYQKTITKNGYIAACDSLKLIRLAPNSFENAYFISFRSLQAWTLESHGLGKEIGEMYLVESKRVVLNLELFEKMQKHAIKYLVFVPGGPCVCFVDGDGKIISA